MVLEVIAFSSAMREWAGRHPRRTAGRRIRDRRGRAVEIGEWRPEDWDGLLAMYRGLAPSQRAQGLPPWGEEQRAVWVDELWRRGPNVVAHAGERIVGHAALVPDRTGSYELVVFVRQEYEGAGLGGALVDALLALARRREVELVRMRVERPNHRALALLRRRGFQQLSANESGEEIWFLSDPTYQREPAAGSSSDGPLDIPNRTRVFHPPGVVRVVTISEAMQCSASSSVR
ncbi:MAG: GNAT family N-acetyltransferase [Gemmatimonadota bacterium]|nr:GNAT family N-acetyltransferase [Gemmatimonadota bacterium]